MSSPYRDIPRLRAETPRAVPLAVRLRVRFGGVPQIVGWTFLGLGVAGLLLVGRFADLRGLSGPLRTSPATIVRKAPTSGHENGRRVWRVEYTFDRGQGVSWGTALPVPPEVEYEADHPERSRLVGMRRAPAPGWLVAFPVPFALIGLGIVAAAQTRAGRSCRLLRDGKVAWGRLRSKQPTIFQINRQPVYELTFEFEVDDRRYEAVARTHQPELLEDDRREQVLYDPADPGQATLVDHLPGGPRVDERGEIASAAPLCYTVAAVLPFALAVLLDLAVLVAVLVG